MPVDLVAGGHFAKGAAIGLDRLRGLGNRITGYEHWDRLAIRRIVDDLFSRPARTRRRCAFGILHPRTPDGHPGRKGPKPSNGGALSDADALARTEKLLAELERGRRVCRSPN